MMRCTGFRCKIIMGDGVTTTSAIIKRLLMDQEVEFQPGDVVVVDVKLTPRDRVKPTRRASAAR